MVLRAWRGYGSVADAEAYPNHLLQTVRPKLEQLDGFRGLYLLRHREADEIEYLVLTLWESMDAVRAFAGEQPETSSLPSNGLAYGITCCCRWSVSIAFPATRRQERARGDSRSRRAAGEAFLPGSNARIAPTTFDAWLNAKSFVTSPA